MPSPFSLSRLRQLVAEALRDRGIYVVALIVGTAINGYGQVLVPWLRGMPDPVAVFSNEFRNRPWLSLLSIILAYAFPLGVGIYTSVVTRNRNG